MAVLEPGGFYTRSEPDAENRTNSFAGTHPII
jgi:hypothetical protein